MTDWQMRRIKNQDVYVSPEGDLYRRARPRERPDREILHRIPGLSPTPVKRLSERECIDVMQPFDGFE